MDIVHPRLDSYLHDITPKRTAVLQKMEDLAERERFPIVGPLVGRILYQYARIVGARRIMELGSGYGYSAFWWALATGDETRIYCTEGSENNIRRGQDFLKQGGFLQKVEYYKGDALQTLDRIEGEFDIVFMDIDKHQYPAGFQKGFPRLRKGGLFITDNVLWSGAVVEETPDTTTAAIIEYNRLIYSTPGAFSTILPVRDGVAVTLKE